MRHTVCNSVRNGRVCYLELSKEYLYFLKKMADNDRIVYPEEVEDAKAAAAEAEDQNKGGDTNTIEETPKIGLRNMIQVPVNCPAGQQMGADGVCRVVSNF